MKAVQVPRILQVAVAALILLGASGMSQAHADPTVTLDGNGNVTGINWSNGITQGFSYDANGNRTSETIVVPTPITITANQNNLNIASFISSIGATQDLIAGTYQVTIAPGVVIGSGSTGTASLDTGNLSANFVLANYGLIEGAGGAGGNGATILGEDNFSNGSPGSPGGAALQVRVATSIDNTNGHIWGGGGGGGGGGGSAQDFAFSIDALGAGGGGGGGLGTVGGAGGAGGTGGIQPGNSTAGNTGSPGGTGSELSSGGGGAGGVPSCDGCIQGGFGGAGGGPGAAGFAGQNGQGSGLATSGGAGGAGGPAIIGSSLVSFIATGDIRGAQQ